MCNLTKLPNIGKELASQLERVGIKSAADLSDVGSIGAIMRLKAQNEDICINKLYALEGAIQGVRWHHLDKALRAELLDFFQNIERNGE